MASSIPTSQLFQGRVGDQQNTYGSLIAPPPAPQKTSAYDRQRLSVQNYPDGVEGMSMQISDTIEELNFTAMQRWQLARVMPIKTIKGLRVDVRLFKALPTFFSVTPAQTVGHMIQQTEERMSVSLVPLSLQAKFEMGFLQTQMGQDRYNAALHQFHTAYIETLHAEIYRAILDSHEPQQEWMRNHGEMTIRQLEEYLKWDLFTFAATQRIRLNPLEKVDAKVTQMMRSNRGIANTWLISENTAVYLTEVPVQNILYSEGGQQAIDRKNGINQNNGDMNKPTSIGQVDPNRLVNKYSVVVTKSYVVEGAVVNPFLRVRQIGEYNILEDRVRTGKFTTDRLTIQIYDQHKDMFVPITVQEAFARMNLFMSNGHVRNMSIPDGRDLDPFEMTDGSGIGIGFIGDMDSRYLTRSFLKRTVNSLCKKFTDEDEDTRRVVNAFTDKLREITLSLKSPSGYTYSDAFDEDNAIGDMHNLLRRTFKDSLTLGTTTKEFMNFFVLAGAYKVNNQTDDIAKDAQMIIESIIKKLFKNGDDAPMIEGEMDDEMFWVNLTDTLVSESGKGHLGQEASKQEINGIVARLRSEYDEYKKSGGPVIDGAGGVVYMDRESYNTRNMNNGRRDGTIGLGDKGKEEEMMEVFSEMPNTFHGLPFIQNLITPSKGRNSRRRRVRLNNDNEVNLDDFTQKIGASMDMPNDVDQYYSDMHSRLLYEDVGSYSTDQLLARFNTIGMHYDGIASSPWSRLKIILGLVYIGTPFTLSGLSKLIEDDIRVPINYGIGRPHNQVETEISVKMQDRGGSGNIYVNQVNTIAGDDTLLRTSVINMTFNMRGFVHQPKNVFIVPDLHVVGYDGGLGTKFFTPSSYDPMNITPDGPSIICFPLPPTSTMRTMNNPLPISGYWPAQFRISDGSNGQRLYATADRVNELYTFEWEEASDLPEIGESHVNMLMYRGHTKADNGRGKIVDYVNTGHWGIDVYAGCKSAREGELTVLRKTNYDSCVN